MGIGNNVVSIGDSAFANCVSLKSIKVPDGVMRIGDSAFSGCSSLTSIILPFVGGYASATSVSYQTLFGYIFGTTKYEGGYFTQQRYTELDEDGYNYTYYQSYYIPSTLKSVTIIGGMLHNGAFSNCGFIESVYLGDGVTSIGRIAFYGCENLSNIGIGDGVTYIGADAFYNTAYYNKSSNWENKVLYIDKYLIEAKSDKTGDYAIKDGTLCIAEIAFAHCGVTSITIPDSVVSICEQAFSHCSMTRIVIGKGVRFIGNYAFYYCTSLIEIYYNATECNDFTWDSCRFDYVGMNKGIKLTIGADVKKIPAEIFSQHSNTYRMKFESVVFESGSVCESIGDSAFYNCVIQSTVRIPKNVTYVGSSAFYNVGARVIRES